MKNMIWVNLKINGWKKWQKNPRQQTAGRVFGSNDDPTFCSVEKINRAFLDFIQKRKNSYRKAGLKCKKCPEIFENLTKRDKHFDAKHRERIIRCDECPQIFHTYYKKNVHKRSVHEKSDKKLNVWVIEIS